MKHQTSLLAAATGAQTHPARTGPAVRPTAMRFVSLLLVLLGGCATSRVDSEKTREIVLNYLGGSVGTAGPFSSQAKQEFGVLSPKDQQEASALIDRGAVAFLIFEAGSSNAVRVVLVHKERIVGDFRAVRPEPKPAAAPAPLIPARR